MRAVFDLDDTICVHKNRDYPNATPINAVAEKIRKMKRDGWEIVIYTARGQVSCNKNLEKIEAQNRPTIERWLRKHKIPCDELIFGKPLGDVYVDDKGMSLRDFLTEPFYPLKGGSGRRVYRVGNMVKKDLGEDAASYKEWVEDAAGLCKFPQVIAYTYNDVTMQYIEGKNLCDCLQREDLLALVEIIDGFGEYKRESFDINEQINILYKNKSGEGFDKTIDYAASKLRKIEHTLKEKASFCHGDTTLSNVIKAADGLYFIDPRYRRNASSYLLDFGKLRMSLTGYEKKFGITDRDNTRFLPEFDDLMRDRGIFEEVVALNLMYVCRLYRYKKDKQAVENMADELIQEAYG